MRTLVFVALDGLTTNEEETFMVAEKLVDSVEKPFGFKINLDYVLKQGLDRAVTEIQVLGRPIFVDLKMFNSSHIMENAAKALVDLGVDYFNIHALADKELEKAAKATKNSKTKLLGVTVLTHYNYGYYSTYFHRFQKKTIALLSKKAISNGCHGIILPGTALSAVSNIKTIKVVPGIRPSWYKDSRHAQKITPKEAKEKGANIIVCGDPIMKSENPINALQKIIEEIS